MIENRSAGLQSKYDICTMKNSGKFQVILVVVQSIIMTKNFTNASYTPGLTITEIEVGLLIGKGCYNDVMKLIGVEGFYVKQKNAEEEEECQQVSSPSPGSSRPASSKYVVKKIRYDLSKSSRNDAALSLSIEAKVLAAISHPNIFLFTA